MAKVVGIDIRATHVRAVLLRTSFRSPPAIERMLEVDRTGLGSLEQALQIVAVQLGQHSDSVAISIEGENAFMHRLKIPATAAKRLDEVLPFELEAQVPVDVDELVFDYHRLRHAPKDGPLIVLTAAARTEFVRDKIALVQRALGREPERIGCGPLPLANLAQLSPELAGPGPVALVDLGGGRTEVVLVAEREPVFTRTLSRGVAGLPETAPALAAELRQTFGAWLAQGNEPVHTVYLVGGGAAAPGAEAYLSHELGIEVKPLPTLAVEGVPPEELPNLPRFAKAISLALGLGARPADLNLRAGPLAYQRGYGFLKEKVPLLSGLGAAILISFVFSTWAEMRALDRNNQVLTKALESLSMDVLGQKTADPEEATQLLQRAQRTAETDPMPHMDAFDVIVEISKAIPLSMTHDIEEFDMHRGHVKVHGVVGSASDAQAIAGAMKERECFDEVKISKITQVINSDRQKYVLEFDVLCPSDEGAKKKKKSGSKEDSE